MLKRTIDFLTHGVWRIRMRDLGGTRSFGLRVLRVVLLTLRGFGEDLCYLRASALTFYSLLSIVPVIAMIFAIGKGFGFEDQIEKILYEKFAGQEQAISRIVEFARSYLNEAQGGIIGGIGVILLFYSVVKVLSNIEQSFNDIWGIKTPRSWMRKLGDYLSFMLIVPLLFVVAGSATLFIVARLEQSLDTVSALGWVKPLLEIGARLVPLMSVWLLFGFIYVFMPNTRVGWKAALVGALVAGTSYQLMQMGYVSLQLGVSRYSAIYGSFAALPLFLIWLQLSWLIVLFGAELSFAWQNVDTYEFEPDCLHISQRFKRLLTLRTAHEIVRRFCAGETPPTAGELVRAEDVPIRLVRQLLFELIEAGIVREVVTDGRHKEPSYMPACDIDRLTVKFIMDRLDQHGSSDLPIAKSTHFRDLDGKLGQLNEAMLANPANVRLKDL